MLPQVKAKYRARCCGAPTWEQNSNSGNWQTAVPFEVSDGEHAGEGITWIGVMHDTADKNGTTGHERVILSFQYMGWQGDDITELAELTDEQAMALLPEEVELSCDLDTFEGKTRLKVQWVNRPGAGRFAFKNAASKSDLRSFAAQLKSTVKAVRAGDGKRGGNKAAPHPNAPDSGDDIPF